MEVRMGMMKRVGELDGRGIFVSVDDGGAVELWLKYGGRVSRLAEILSGPCDGLRTVIKNGDALTGQEVWMVCPYDGALDQRLVELIDLLVGIRLGHPRMVQLELEMPAEEGERLQLALEGMGG